MRSRVVSAALLSSALLLTGCGTGLQATTYTKERSPRDFDGRSIADLEVRNLGIAAPATGTTIAATDTAVLNGTVVNTGDTDDSLVGVETDIAGSAAILLDGKPAGEVPIPAGGDSGELTISLSALSQDLHVGQYVDVTLVFAHAGRLPDLQVPVRIGDTGLSDRTPAQDPYEGAE
ncbi:MAG: copper chaperone PCu(A)C [Mycobacteriales bacterium]